MVTALLNAVMERRARQLMAMVGDWLPSGGPVLDLGSGTGHLASRLEREMGIAVVTADVSDIHIAGPPPILIADGRLPFADDSFSAALLCFILAYPEDPATVLAEVARVTSGPIIVVQTVRANRAGHLWLRGREFLWTIVAFHGAKLLGYVPPEAQFAMRTRRFYTERALQRDAVAAGLRLQARRERHLLPGRSLFVAAWTLVRDE